MLGCTPKWSIRGSWNGTHDSPPSGAKLPHAGRPTPLCAFSASAAVQNLAQQRRLLCPASAEGQELDAYDTERTLSVGRTPRSVPLTTVSPPQRRQRYKICPNTDACHPSVAGVPSLGPATTPAIPTHKKPHLRSSNLNYFSPTTGVRFTEESSVSIAISVVAERNVHTADQRADHVVDQCRNGG